MAVTRPAAVGLTGAGRIGSFHAESIVRQVPDATPAFVGRKEAGKEQKS